MRPAPAPDDGTPALEQLMAGYQRGEEPAAAALWDAVSPALYRFFAAQAATRHEAEDLLQEAFLRIHRARHTYRPGEPVLPWMYGIARHVRIDAYRRQRRRDQREMGTELPPEVAPPTPAPERAKPAPLTPLLEHLPPSQREVLLMTKVSGMSVEEVARATGSTAGAVKQKAHRAYLTLRRLIEGGKP